MVFTGLIDVFEMDFSCSIGFMGFEAREAAGELVWPHHGDAEEPAGELFAG